jgi:hypothetical protein
MTSQNLTLPAVDGVVFLSHMSRVLLVKVTAVRTEDRMVALFGHEGWYNWDKLGPQQDDLRALYVIGDEVVD